MEDEQNVRDKVKKDIEKEQEYKQKIGYIEQEDEFDKLARE